MPSFAAALAICAPTGYALGWGSGSGGEDAAGLALLVLALARLLAGVEGALDERLGVGGIVGVDGDAEVAPVVAERLDDPASEGLRLLLVGAVRGVERVRLGRLARLRLVVLADGPAEVASAGDEAAGLFGRVHLPPPRGLRDSVDEVGEDAAVDEGEGGGQGGGRRGGD